MRILKITIRQLVEVKNLAHWLVIGQFRMEQVLKFIRPKCSPVLLIKIGGNLDGAYYVPDDMDGINYCVSPGVNNCKYFEDELLNKYDISSVLCDPTTHAPDLITPLIPGKQLLVSKWLTSRDSETSITLKTMVDSYCGGDTSDKLLQIDIEGGEYEAILSCDKKTLTSFRIIVIEVHGLQDVMKPWGNGFSKIIGLIQAVESHFTCVHAHANNCCGDVIFPGTEMNVPLVLELTLLRNDRFTNCPHARSEGGLKGGQKLEDVINVKDKEPLLLRDIWLAEPHEFDQAIRNGRLMNVLQIVSNYVEMKRNALRSLLG